MTTTTTATQNEIARLAYKLKWTTAIQYRKHISTEASFEENLLSLLRIADDDRERTLVKRRLKAASFPIQKTLDTFRFDPAGLPNLKQEQILELPPVTSSRNGPTSLPLATAAPERPTS